MAEVVEVVRRGEARPLVLLGAARELLCVLPVRVVRTRAVVGTERVGGLVG